MQSAFAGIGALAALTLAAAPTVFSHRTRSATLTPRQRFAIRISDIGRSMRLVEAGEGVTTSVSPLTRADVMPRVGRPDSVTRRGFPGQEPREFWYCGMGPHRTFPTLGCVEFDGTGHVRAVWGATGTPDTGAVPEPALRQLIEQVDQIVGAREWDPLLVLQTANVLGRLGRRDALRVIGEYVRLWRVQDDFETWHDETPETLYPFLDILFPTKERLPGTHYYASRRASLACGIPFCLAVHLGGAGASGFWREDLSEYARNAPLLEAPLRPGADPLRALDILQPSGLDRKELMNQIVRLVRTAYTPAGWTGWPDALYRSDAELEKEWTRVRGEISRTKLVWDDALECYRRPGERPLSIEYRMNPGPMNY